MVIKRTEHVPPMTELHGGDAASASPIDIHGVQVPRALAQVATEVERSRTILDLEDDWDNAGAMGYAEDTWRRAVELLVRIAAAAWEEHGTRVEDIFVSPGDRGSIDLEIRTAGHELLMTVPADEDAEVRFYGDDGTWGSKQKGSFPIIKPNRWLAAWLAD
ncbi:MAG: hypothetical protein ACRDJW_05185 [Thermomicrobiales bacterium]